VDVKTIYVPPLVWHELIRDVLMVPIMCILGGTFFERPQRTHQWNNLKLRRAQVKHLLQLFMVWSRGVPSKKRFVWKIPLFHMRLFGGWKQYVVLEPIHPTGVTWHVGWVAEDVIGVSRITLSGPVRVLVGNGDVFHFGLATSGVQIPIRKIGEGIIGGGGLFAWTPFL
jgi:hypothetical protein